MNCGGVEYDITMKTCARYWSEYVPLGGQDPEEMFAYLPGEHPVPDVPIPAGFAVHVSSGHANVVWEPYWVHAYSIETRIGGGAWATVATLTDYNSSSWIDYGVTIPDPKGRGVYYRMRGRVYGAYFSYTEELQALPEVQRIVP